MDSMVKNIMNCHEKFYRNQKNIGLKRETKDFDLIYKERSKNVKSILIGDERVEDYFYKNPWRYSFSRKYAFGMIIQEFRKLKEVDRGGLHILDIGCGNGWFSINANLDNKNHWDCIDISPKAISVAKKYKKDLNITNNSYYVKSLEGFKKNKKYDIVTCVNTLHHLTDLNIFYLRVKGHLKPNGKIFVHDVSPDLFSEVNAVFVLLIRTVLGFTHEVQYFEDFTTSDISEQLEAIIYEWQNETDNKKQSYYDHYHPTQEIIAFLKNKFAEISYKQHGGILMRLLGGLRGEMSLLKRLSEQLMTLEKLLIDKRLIGPYNYTFIGELR